MSPKAKPAAAVGDRLPYLLGKLKTPRVLERLEQTAATARKRGAKIAHRPPAPIASPMREALSASPSENSPGPRKLSHSRTACAVSAAAAR